MKNKFLSISKEEYSARPKFPANSEEFEVMFYGNDSIDRILDLWHKTQEKKKPSFEDLANFGPSGVSQYDELSKNESHIQLMQHLKHQARNCFSSRFFQDKYKDNVPNWLQESRSKLALIQPKLSPDKNENKEIYNKHPLLYWHYAVLTSHIGSGTQDIDMIRYSLNILNDIKHGKIACGLYKNFMKHDNNYDNMDEKIDTKIQQLKYLVQKMDAEVGQQKNTSYKPEYT